MSEPSQTCMFPDAYEVTPDDVRRATKCPLPGRQAQLSMATLPRRMDPLEQPRDAAVLILLYPKDGTLHLLLMLRPQKQSHHAGQISCPGGAREGSELLAQTAIRETFEEFAVKAEEFEIVGTLTPLYVPSSNYCIHPFIALAHSLPAFDPAAKEVEEMIEVPLRLLLDPASRREQDWSFQGQRRRVRFFQVGEHAIWGATAMILGELTWLLCPPTESLSL